MSPSEKLKLSLLVAFTVFMLVSGCLGQTAKPKPSPTKHTSPPTIHPTKKPAASPSATASPTIKPPTSTPQPSKPSQKFKGDIYVAIVMHSEDPHHPAYPDFRTNKSAYIQYRQGLLKFAEILYNHGLKFDFQTDWNFLEGIRKWENQKLTSSTQGMNIIKYLHDVLGDEIDPHSHEHDGYNYADVAYLIQLLDTQPSTVVGGHIYNPKSPNYQNWPRFEETLKGLKYPEAEWKAEILWGESTVNHVDDPVVSGVWKPKDPYHFFEHSEKGKLITIGGYERNIEGVNELVSKYEKGELENGKIYTVNVFVEQSQAVSEDFRSFFEKTILNSLEKLESEDLIYVTTLEDIAKIWKEKYHEIPNIYIKYIPKLS